MTMNERKKLNALKVEVLDGLGLENISDIELYKFLTTYSWYYNDEDIATMSQENKLHIMTEIEEFLNEKEHFNKLEKLLEYIHEKDYDLDHLLYLTNYTEEDLDTSTLTPEQIIYLADELENEIIDFEYQTELHNLEEQVSLIETKQNELQDLAYEFNINADNNTDNNQLIQFQEEKNKLLNEIQLLKENHEQINKEALVKEIQAKRYLSPKELAILKPDMSISSQQTYRGRLRDKIPFQQKGKDCKITYDIKEVEVWLENQNWKHK